MPRTRTKPRSHIAADGTIMLFGVIGDEWDGCDAQTIVSEIKALGDVDEITVQINSLGGIVTDGLAIYNELATHEADVTVEISGVAASMASAIAMAGSTIRMAKNAHFMIHDPWNVAVGNSEEMRRAADLLDKFGTSLVDIYADRTGLDTQTITEMMAKDGGEGTWLSAEEAKEFGFIDEVVAPVEAVAFADLDVSEMGVVPAALTRLIREGKQMAKSKQNPPTSVVDKPDDQVQDEPELKAPQDAPPPAASVAPSDLDARIAEVARKAQADERERVGGIQSMARRVGLDQDWIDEQVSAGASIQEASAAALDALADRQDREGGPSQIPGAVTITADEQDKWLGGMTAWLVVKSGQARLIEAHTNKRPDPGQFRGYRLLDIARDSLDRAGVNTRGMSPHDIARAAIRGQGLGTRSDFPVLLENVLHKILLAAYETAPDQWRSIATTGSVSDFRPHPRLRLGSLSRLDQKLESGEFRQKHFPDAEKEVVQAGTVGNIIGLTREAIVNDDVDGFSRLTSMLGRAAARSIEIDVFALLALNGGLGPVMADGKTLFHADHNNIDSTAGAPSIERLEAVRVLMAQQKDPDGNDFLNLRPDVWAGPIGLGSAVRIAIGAEYDFEAEGSGNGAQYRRPNVVKDLLSTVVDTPRLTGTRWYTFASPDIAPTLEVVFLDGQESPQIVTEEGFDYDGVRWRIMHDYGVGAVDHRGAVTNAGD